MPGLVPGIHVFPVLMQQRRHGRDKPGHDERVVVRREVSLSTSSRTSERKRTRSGIHNHRTSLFENAGATSRDNNKGQWLWVPAFAGTTRGDDTSFLVALAH